MEPVYKGFQDIVEFYSKYGIDSHTDPSEEEMEAREALLVLAVKRRTNYEVSF